MKQADLKVRYGKNGFLLNYDFIRRHGAEDNLWDIHYWFTQKFWVWDLIVAETEPEKLKAYAKDLTEIEFEIQKAFNFEPDVRFHRFWEAPRCGCPRLDNTDCWGTERRIVNAECVLHGL